VAGLDLSCGIQEVREDIPTPLKGLLPLTSDGSAWPTLDVTPDPRCNEREWRLLGEERRG
jgi:hypothetical protein